MHGNTALVFHPEIPKNTREAENTSPENSRAFLRRLWPLKRYSENDKASRRVAAAITFPHHTPSPDTQLPAVVPDWYVDTPRARARGFSDAASAAARVPPERCRDSASATSRQTRCRLVDAPRSAPRRRGPGRNARFGESQRLIRDVRIDPHRVLARNRVA